MSDQVLGLGLKTTHTFAAYKNSKKVGAISRTPDNKVFWEANDVKIPISRANVLALRDWCDETAKVMDE